MRTESRAVALLVLLGLIGASGLARGQAEFPVAVEPEASARQRLYEQLAADADEFERKHNLLKRVVQLTRPTVVHLEAERAETPRSKGSDEAGSGILVQFGSKFYVLTNRHVIRDAPLRGVHIRLHDGRVIHPVQVLADRATDVAVLAVSAPDLVAARIGDSGTLEIGEFVLAVGSPFGLSHSVTYGIISAKGRRDLQLGEGREGVPLQDFLQTDAAINPGNSGGPLLNLRGEVIGINTAIASNSGGSEGIGFAIPINMAVVIARQLLEQGYVARAYLGVKLDSQFTAEDATRLGLPRLSGARVTAITPRSPADLAELLPGDVILRFDGKEVEDDNHLINLVGLTSVNKTVPLAIFRDGRSQTLQVKVINRPEVEGE
jgi:serine protease Do